MKSQTQKQATEIKSASVARGVDKATHETFYVVQSDSDPNTWYQVRWNTKRTMWCCDCPATCSGCKHNRAVQEVLALRRARIAAQMGGETPAIVAKLQATEDKRNQAVAPASDIVAILTPEGISMIDKSEVTEHDILAAPLGAQDRKMERAPSGRLVPMR